METSDIGILIVDDEFSVRDSLDAWFSADGFRTGTAASADEALAALDRGKWEIVLTDIKMPGMDGMALLRRIKSTTPDTVVIMITAFAAVDTAIQALKDGAFDYICKPIDPDELTHIVRNVMDAIRLRNENRELREGIDRLAAVDEIVGGSAAIRNMIRLIGEVAPTDSTVMIRGESGTGKELAARAIHMNSRRKYFSLVTVNCGAIAETLLEDELFGHEKGAFTGAQYLRKGKLETADRGTIFFDEIGDIPPRMQIDILRVIETKRFTRLGGDKEIGVDFRIISATNRDLEQMVKDGTFREDLYYRLNVFRIDLPALRDRAEDIEPIARYWLGRLVEQMNKPVEGFTEQALARLAAHPWPGNVRELRNVIERALVSARGRRIDAADLSLPATGGPAAPTLMSIADMEKVHIEHVLRQVDWNISRAAEVLEIDRATLYNKIKKYGLRT
ncbi:MAG: sigma-54-dependent Fis family transcriptional regulator [Deltaproteobacteria bacterium]|nr:sigma-54-dependent Fis family transcriptional regulator [Deltaproteobacteria bacterium]